MVSRKLLVTVLILFALFVPVVCGDVVPRDWLTEVLKGNVDGHSLVTVRSHSHVVGTTEQIVWDLAVPYVFPTSATLMNVSSGDVDDVVGDTGAWNVTVQGLDADWVEQQEVVQLNGRTPVSTVKQYIRINDMHCIKAGSSGFNEGKIYIGVGAVTLGVPATVYNVIHEGYGLSSTGLYSVPVNHTAYLLWGVCGTPDNKEVAFILQRKCCAGNDGAVITMRHIHLVQDYLHFTQMYAKIAGTTDLMLKSDAASADTDVEFNVKLLLVDDDVLHDSTLDWSDGSSSSVDATISSEITVSDPENQTFMYVGVLIVIAVALAAVASGRRW